MHYYRFTAALLIFCCRIAGAENGDSPPVIIISIDTLRADHLSAYGYTKVHTANLDAFAEHGTIFKAVDSQIPLTLPSHTCLFTSTYPFENGVEENAEIVPSSLLTLASVLQQHGYRTGAFIGSDLLAQRFGLDRGFDVYDSPFHPSESEPENPYDVRVRRDASLVLRSAMQWLAVSRSKPAFLFVHLFDLHAPYSVASPNRLQPNIAGYDTEIEYVDRVIGRFRKTLVDQGWWNRALVILLSDHGESLNEHGEISHGYFVYQSTLWVPLLMHWPEGAQPLPSINTEPAGLIDVAPTILDFLHIHQPPDFRGASLLKQSLHRPVYSETMYPHDAFRWSPLRSLRIDDFQYIDAPNAELYNIRTDQTEERSVIRSNPVEARELKNELRALMANNAMRHTAVVHDTSIATVAALRSLGYVSDSSRSTSEGVGPDPKERLQEYQAYERGLEALYGGREPQAVAIFKQLLVRDPANTIARYYLGEAYLRLHRRDDALREWKTALQLDPAYAPASEAIRKFGAQPPSK